MLIDAVENWTVSAVLTELVKTDQARHLLLIAFRKTLCRLRRKQSSDLLWEFPSSSDYLNNVLKTLVTYCAEETLVATAEFEEYQSELNLITNAETLFGNQ